MKIELAHDIIAEKIWERLPEVDKQLRLVQRSLAQRAEDYHAGKGSLLGIKELAGWEDLIPKLNLTATQQAYIKASRLAMEAELASEKRKRRRAVILAIIGFVLAAVATAASIWAIQAQQQTESALIEATDAKQEADAERDRAEQLQREAEQERDNAQAALERFQQEEAAKVLQNVEDIITRANRLRSSYPQVYREMINEAKKELRKYPDNPILIKRLEGLNQ